MLRNITSKAFPLKNAIPFRHFSVSPCNNKTFKIQDLNDFDNKVKANKLPVIVDFYATWCNPCRTLTPRLEKLMLEREGKVDLATVDIDQNTDLALQYDVGTVPTLIIMTNGKVKHRLVGLQDADKLSNWIDQNTKS